jgi:hypothetical protein
VKAGRFEVLCRAFFAQFFASESVASDHQLRQAMIGVLAFLITPALLIPVQMNGAFEFAAIRFPALLEPLTQLMATIFITYSMVSIGVIAAVVWDTLSFDRRDAMVLGPLPLRGTTVVAAKLAALAVFLLTTAAAINVMTAVPFSMVAGSHKPVVGVSRHFAAHMIATLCAATFVFCLLITLRGVLGMVAGGRLALASLLQFALVSALLCFIVLVPTALHVIPGRRGAARVYLQPIPAWSPTNWFLGLYEVIRGSSPGEFGRGASRAIAFTLSAIASSIVITIMGYRRQLQLALTPTASIHTLGGARLQRAIARLFLGRNRLAYAASDFILTTVSRNRAQQAPIAINAAIGLAIVVIGLSRSGNDMAALMRPRTAILWIPLVLAYWTAIGLRAAFFVPSELPAAWSFRFNAPDRPRAYWSAVRASTIAFLLPIAWLIDGVLALLIGWRVAAWHALVTSAIVVMLGEAIALTVDGMPFTRPYRPGHAKVRTRWPLYLLGMYAFAFWPARLELWMVGRPAAILQLSAWMAGGAAALELVGRRRAARWTREGDDESGEDEPSGISVLDIGLVAHDPSRP